MRKNNKLIIRALLLALVLSVLIITPNARAAAPTIGLVAHWKFEGNASDSSGFGNNGTLFGDPTFTSGKLGQGLSFDGVDDFVDVVSAILTANGSLSIWFKPDWNSGDSIINGIAGATTDGDNFFRIEHFLDNNWYAGWVTGNIDHRAVISSATMSVISGSWYHLAVVWDDTTNVTMVYLNGVSKGQNTSLVTNSIIQPLRIGSYDATTDGFFDGTIDDVRVYNRALTYDEIKRLYNLGR